MPGQRKGKKFMVSNRENEVKDKIFGFNKTAIFFDLKIINFNLKKNNFVIEKQIEKKG